MIKTKIQIMKIQNTKILMIKTKNGKKNFLIKISKRKRKIQKLKIKIKIIK